MCCRSLSKTACLAGNPFRVRKMACSTSIIVPGPLMVVARAGLPSRCSTRQHRHRQAIHCGAIFDAMALAACPVTSARAP